MSNEAIILPDDNWETDEGETNVARFTPSTETAEQNAE